MSYNKRKKYVEKLLPEIEEIEDPTIKRNVYKVWIQIWKQSEWQRIEDVPFNLKAPEFTLVEHLRGTYWLAMGMAQYFKNLNRVSINLDILRAGALLHDVTKMLECRKKDDLLEATDFAKKIPHGAIGACKALDLGLSLDIAHLIAAHTPTVEIVCNTIEGIIMSYADLCNADILFKLSGCPTLLSQLS